MAELQDQSDVYFQTFGDEEWVEQWANSGYKYEFVERLGKGTFGKVASITLAGCGGVKIAKKQIKYYVDSQEIAIQREIALLRLLSDVPNVVKCYGFSRDELYYNIFIEVCESHVYLKHWQSSEALAIMCGVMNALSACHDRHIIHGDIKMENVLLVKSDASPSMSFPYIVKICDFGSAACTTIEGLSITEPKITELYIAPETKADGTMNSKTDIWCGGCLFTELLNLKRMQHPMNPTLDGNHSNDIVDMQCKMTAMKCEDRPSATRCYEWFASVDNNEECEEKT
eukprot:223388_1